MISCQIGYLLLLFFRVASPGTFLDLWQVRWHLLQEGFHYGLRGQQLRPTGPKRLSLWFQSVGPKLPPPEARANETLKKGGMIFTNYGVF